MDSSRFTTSKSLGGPCGLLLHRERQPHVPCRRNVGAQQFRSTLETLKSTGYRNSTQQQLQCWTFGKLQEVVKVPSLQVGSNSQGAAMAVVDDAPRLPSTAHARASHVPIAT